MAAPFPATPSSPSYAYVTPTNRCSIYYGPSSTPSWTLQKAGSASYVVLNWQGTQILSGSLNMTSTTVTLPVPNGGWAYGWYRLYCYDGSGASSAASNFCIIRANANFVTNPVYGTDGNPGGDGAAPDLVARGVMGLGPQRFYISNGNAPTTGNPTIAETLTNAACLLTYQPVDANRPSPLLCQFPNGAYDVLFLLDSGGDNCLAFYCKDGTINGANITIAVASGSVSGFKVTVANSGTPVETYDNYTDPHVFATATLTSAYIRAFAAGYSGNAPVNASAVAIGNAFFTGVESVVSVCYPTIEWYEGPQNEPEAQVAPECVELVQKMIVFRAAVKAGASGAKALGPSFVTAQLQSTQLPAMNPDWPDFLAAVAASATPVLDGISFHAYNMLNGDLSMMRTNLAQFTELIASNGLGNLPLWQTEQGVFTPIYGVYHPRRARWSMLQILVQESFGIPKEQNYLWYDFSHGFWSQPTFWENANGGFNPQAVMLRVFAEEVFGCPFSANISFGTIGDRMYFGGLWKNPGTAVSVAVFMSPSPVSGGSVTLTVTGTTSQLTVVDCWGNSSTVTPVGGRVTLAVLDTPVYLQLPNGVSVAPYTVGSWSTALFNAQSNLCVARSQSSTSTIANGVWENGYDGNPSGGAGGVGPVSFLYGAEPPETGTQISFQNPQRFDRIIIWCGMVWQQAGTLTDFDVQTSNDGSTWTTQATVTDVPPTTLNFVTDFTDVGCTVETYWPEPWIFDVLLPSPVNARYIRLNTRSASYGGEPDATSYSTGGQGTTPETYAIEEIALFLGASPLVLFPVTLG